MDSTMSLNSQPAIRGLPMPASVALTWLTTSALVLVVKRISNLRVALAQYGIASDSCRVHGGDHVREGTPRRSRTVPWRRQIGRPAAPGHTRRGIGHLQAFALRGLCGHQERAAARDRRALGTAGLHPARRADRAS